MCDPIALYTYSRLRRTVFACLRIQNLSPEDRLMRNQYQAPQRHLKESLFRDPDKAPQQIYRPWESWPAQ